MFNPEFRYLIAQEEEIMPLIDNHEFAAIITCGINVCVFGSIGWLAYNFFEYNWLAIKYVCSAIWDSLTPAGIQLLDIVLLTVGLTSSIIMYTTIIGIADVLENGFTKLKNELNKKDERIKELESELEAKEIKIKELRKGYNKKDELDKDILDDWISNKTKFLS